MNYEDHYNKLIDRAKNRLLEGYSEKHHIIPKCMGGNNSVDNLVRLLPEEHYLAHLLLIKMEKYKSSHTFYKLVYAANMMTIGIGRNNKTYGWVKRKLNEVQRQTRRGRKQSLETIEKRVLKIKGLKRTPEQIERCKQAKQGKKRKPFSKEWREKISKGNIGKIMSEEAKQKISKANSGKKKPPRTKEHAEKIASCVRGTKNSQETKDKKSQAIKLVWIKRRKNNKDKSMIGQKFTQERKDAITKGILKKNKDKIISVFTLLNEGQTILDISKKLNLKYNNVKNWVKNKNNIERILEISCQILIN